MEEATWYLGPLGNMRPLIVPEPDIEINEVRYGGVHQGLSGARIMDVTGYRAEYSFEFRHLDREEYLWLEALHTRLVPGPFYLLNPLKRNRLTQQASRLQRTEYSNSGLDFDSPYTVERDWPDEVRVPGRSVRFADWEGSELVITFDPTKPVPLLPGETMTGSVYMKADDEYQGVFIRVSWYTEDLEFISDQEIEVDCSPEWRRMWYTYHDAPTNAAAAKFKVVLGEYDEDNGIYIAAPMLEAGVTWPSEWELGGGAPVVLLDQLPSVSHRYPLRNATLTLLEA